MIIKDLANRASGNLLFAKEKYQHSYPHCWRCHTPLIYFRATAGHACALRDKLVSENEASIGSRSISRKAASANGCARSKIGLSRASAIGARHCRSGPVIVPCQEVAGSVADVSHKPRQYYYVMRHANPKATPKKF